MPAESTFHDFTYLEPPRPSRWDTAAEGAVRVLDGLLVKAGLPDRLTTPLAMLDRAEELVRSAQRERESAHTELEEASRRLLTGGTDLTEYAQVLRDVQPWISSGPDAGPGGLGIGDIAARIRSNAVQTTHAMSAGLHGAVRDRCAEAIDGIARIPLPKEIWSTTSIAAASTLAIREGFADSWALLVKAADVWDSCHRASELLRECGSLQQEQMFAGPTSICVRYLSWEEALAGLQELQTIPGALKLRYAVDRNWRPGCWLLSDHRLAEAEAAKPKRGLFASLAGR